MEYGESLEQAAAREVYEETGLRISESSLVQLHTFSGNDYEFTLPNGDQISAVTTLFYLNNMREICILMTKKPRN